jgi:hypothetical protein
MKKLGKNQFRLDRLQLLAAILAWWRRLVASNKVLNLFYWAMHAVLYRRTVAAIKMATFLGAFVDCCLFACCPGSRWGNTEWVVAQWWCPVAYGVALDMPHWAMLSVLLRRTAMAIEMAGRWMHLFIIVTLFVSIYIAIRSCYGQLKLKTS